MDGSPVAMKLERHLDRLYANRFPAEERAAKARLWRTLCDTFFNRYVPAAGTVLDIGAGYCDFINNTRAARRIAIDLNPDTPKCAAEGVEVVSLPLDQMASAIAAGSVDLAFASNVFEHLRSPEALLETLAATRRVLRPGGLLVVMQPNVRAVGGAFWDYFDHTLPLTEKGLGEALTISGFAVIERRARFLPYTTKSWLPQWPFLVRLYCRLRPIQWVMGKQMLVVARRL